jgi:dTDP-4-amino-4,6-dideoxygalactose transaminase
MKEIITVTKPDLPPLERYVKYLEIIWKNRWLTNNGELVQLFEKKLRDCLGVKNIAVVCNGTLALHIALKVFDLKGEVITTPFTFAATTNAIIWEGLSPVFADIDPETFNIDPSDVERKVTKDTSAILAVHTYGNPCYVEELEKIAEEYNLKLIYDAAHAFGVEYKNKSVLCYGNLSTLSFHATKIFHTIEGGAVVVDDDALHEKVELLRNHGIKSEEETLLVGTNAKMNEFQAAMGLCNLEDIVDRIQRRKMIYELYKKRLSEMCVAFQKIIASKYNYAYMPVLFERREERDRVYSELAKNNIKPRKYFYPLTPNFDYFTKKGEDYCIKYNLKNAIDVSNRVLCLPLYPDLNISTIEKIIDIIKDTVKG